MGMRSKYVGSTQEKLEFKKSNKNGNLYQSKENVARNKN